MPRSQEEPNRYDDQNARSLRGTPPDLYKWAPPTTDNIGAHAIDTALPSFPGGDRFRSEMGPNGATDRRRPFAAGALSAWIIGTDWGRRGGRRKGQMSRWGFAVGRRAAVGVVPASRTGRDAPGSSRFRGNDVAPGVRETGRSPAPCPLPCAHPERHRRENGLRAPPISRARRPPAR